MRDRLSLYPLETPLPLSDIMLGVRDQEARELLRSFELKVSAAWIGTETFQHLPQALSIPIGEGSNAKTVTVHDDRGRLVEVYQNGRRSRFSQEDVVKHSQSHQEMVDRVRSSPSDLVDPTVVAMAVKDRLVRVASPVLDNDKNVAYWISSWPALDELSEIDAAAVGITAKYSTFSLKQGGKFSTLGRIDIAEYAGAFTRGTLSSTGMGDLRDGVGLDLDKPYYVIAADTSDASQVIYRGRGLFRGEVEDKTIFAINSRKSARPGEVTAPFNEAGVFNGTTFGISSKVEGLEAAQRGSYEALIALGFGSSAAQKGAIYYDGLGAYRGLARVNPKVLNGIIKEGIGTILDYDGQDGKGLDFLETLEAFVDSGRNLMKASETLHMHRNSVLYRLNRLAEIISQSSDSGKRMKWLELTSNPLKMGGIELAIYAHRIRPHLIAARILCALDNPEDLM